MDSAFARSGSGSSSAPYLVTSSGGPVRWVTAEGPHRESVPRWRWMPSWWRWRPQRDSYWTAITFPEGGTGFVIERSLVALRERMVEQVRFWYEEDHCSVGWIWTPPEEEAEPTGEAPLTRKARDD